MQPQQTQSPTKTFSSIGFTNEERGLSSTLSTRRPPLGPSVLRLTERKGEGGKVHE